MDDRQMWVSLGTELIASMQEGWRLLGLIVVDRQDQPRLNLEPQAVGPYVDLLERAFPAAGPQQEGEWRAQLFANAGRNIRDLVLERLRGFAKRVDAYLEERMEEEGAAPSILGPWPHPEGLGALQHPPLDKLMDAPAEAFPLAVRWSWRRTQ